MESGFNPQGFGGADVAAKERAYAIAEGAQRAGVSGNGRYTTAASVIDPSMPPSSPFNSLATAQNSVIEAAALVRDLANRLCGPVPENATEAGKQRIHNNSIFELTAETADVIEHRARDIVRDIHRIQRCLP